MKTALTNVRVFDGNQLTDPRTVVIDDTLIGTDPTGAQEIDGAGAVLLPGLIDAHVHLPGPEALDTLAGWGVTTGLDMACYHPEQVVALRKYTSSADFRTAGLPALGPDGLHARVLTVPAEAIIWTADDARKHVAARVAEGVDYVKGMVEAPGEGGPSLEALQALVAEAHAHNLKTVLHAASVGAYTLAAQSGTDFITHIPADGPIRPEDVAAIRANGQIVIPTISSMAPAVERLSGGRFSVSGLLENVVALQQAGIELLAGTDAEYGGPFGETMHGELGHLASIGMRPVDILRSATVLTAYAFGLSDRGAILPGLRADLVLVDGDPTTDITATRNIRSVWCAGRQTTWQRLTARNV